MNITRKNFFFGSAAVVAATGLKAAVKEPPAPTVSPTG